MHGIPLYKITIQIHVHKLLVSERTKNWQSKGKWSLALLIFLTLSTVKFPTYDVCQRNMHESLCNLKTDYQFNYMTEVRNITKKKNLSFILTREYKLKRLNNSRGPRVVHHCFTRMSRYRSTNTEHSPDSNQFARPWVSRQSGQNPM